MKTIVRLACIPAVLLCLTPSAFAQYAQQVDPYAASQGHYLTLPQGYQKQPSAPVTAYQVQPQPMAQTLPQRQQPVVISQAVQQQPQAQPIQPQQPPSGTTQFDQLQKFPYDPSLDMDRNAYHTPKAQDPKFGAISLGTETGGEFGLQVSHYRYQEHVVANQEFMHLSGANYGATLSGNKSYQSGFFFGGDIRAVYGSHDYVGGDENIYTGQVFPSTHSGESDWLFETRAVAGKDFIFNNAFWGYANFGLSPYAGLGFRYLYNNGQGNDTNGVPGYERYSHYLYVPIGITPRFRVTDTTRLSLNMEYDYLLYGWQVSALGDEHPGETDLTNNQTTGYGFRSSLMFETKIIAFGPFFYYWNINQSDLQCNNAECGSEPHNQTIEYGLQGKIKF